MSNSPVEDRKTRRRMSATERRAQIVAAAANLYDRRGYSNTSMDELASELGIAKPTLYHYFSSKDEILHAIHEEFIDLLLDRHAERAESALAPADALLAVMTDVLSLMQTHRGHVRVFFEHFRELAPRDRIPVRRKRKAYEDIVCEIILDGIDKGVFKPIDARMATMAVFGMCNWAYQWYSPQRGGYQAIAQTFHEFIMYGMASRPG